MRGGAPAPIRSFPLFITRGCTLPASKHRGKYPCKNKIDRLYVNSKHTHSPRLLQIRIYGPVPPVVFCEISSKLVRTVCASPLAGRLYQQRRYTASEANTRHVLTAWEKT